MANAEKMLTCENGRADAVLHDSGASKAFYERRFQSGYMDSWPVEKLDRVAGLLRELKLGHMGCALDYGCGTGVFTEVLQAVLAGWTVEGTDIADAALEAAAVRVPSCRFFPLSACEAHLGRFDLVFTHHVLEHVPDLAGTAALIARLLKPTGVMVHILPCGDAGSFEYQVCTLRTNGIQREMESRFFYEEEGHLRRLTTQALEQLWVAYGYRVDRAFYANHLFGGIRFASGGSAAFVRVFADPRFAIGKAEALKLWLLRAGLMALWLSRKPRDVVISKLDHSPRRLRDWVLLLGGLAAYPFSWTVDSGLGALCEREWSERRLSVGGSEMYVLLKRGDFAGGAVCGESET